jgi:hypothetical protein
MKRLFTLGIKKIKELAIIFVLLFSTKKYVLILGKMVWATLWATFFTTSAGHLAAEVTLFSPSADHDPTVARAMWLFSAS